MNIEETPYDTKITSFISQNPRNKLIIVKHDIIGIEFINMDFTLSNAFIDIIGDPHFSMKAKDVIATIITNGLKSNTQVGRYVVISNLGILLEDELRFDFESFIDDHSQNQVLFLKWEGEIDHGKLYFLTKQKGLEIDISGLSYIVI